jgi:hypothetical protein
LNIRVVPDIAGLDGKEFDYLVPDNLEGQIRVGGIVRVALQGRRVRAWVTAIDVQAPAGVTLKPIAMVSRGGMAPEVLDLARWASWRWAGRLVHVLDTASGATGRTSAGLSSGVRSWLTLDAHPCGHPYPVSTQSSSSTSTTRA